MRLSLDEWGSLFVVPLSAIARIPPPTSAVILVLYCMLRYLIPMSPPFPTFSLLYGLKNKTATAFLVFCIVRFLIFFYIHFSPLHTKYFRAFGGSFVEKPEVIKLLKTSL
jgi:hypothetical protein